MALSNTQIVLLQEVTYQSRDKIVSAISSLNAEEEAAIADDLDTWETIRDSHVKVQGGSDGIDYDNERKREGIRRRINNLLGFSLISSRLNPVGGAYSGASHDSLFTVDLHQG